MFGYGAINDVASKKTFTRWSVTEDTSAIVKLSVNTTGDGLSYRRIDHDHVMATLRTVNDAAASAMVTKYIGKANAWTDNACAIAACNQEYTRISAKLAERLASGEYTLLKRIRPSNNERQPKRIRIETVRDVHTQVVEMTGGNDNGFYSVAAGDLYGPPRYIGTSRGSVPAVSVAGGALDFSQLVPREPVVLGNCGPPGLLSDPYRRQLQLKHHMTSIGQAFIHAESGKDSQNVFAEDHLQDWMSSRHRRPISELQFELTDTAALAARILSFKEEHQPCVRIGSLGEWLPMHKSSTDDTHEITLGKSTWKIKKKVPPDVWRFNETDKTEVRYQFNNGKASDMQIENNLTFSSRWVTNDSEIENFKTCRHTRSDKSWDEVLMVKHNTDKEEAAWYSKNVYSKVIKELRKGETTSPPKLVSDVEEFIGSIIHNQKQSSFEQGTVASCQESDNALTDANIMLLTPVPPDELRDAVKSVAEVRFGTRLTGKDTFRWFIGASPTPSLDAIDAAITCLQSKVNS